MQQEQKKPWRKPEIRILNLTLEMKARLFPHHFAKETVDSK